MEMSPVSYGDFSLAPRGTSGARIGESIPPTCSRFAPLNRSRRVGRPGLPGVGPGPSPGAPRPGRFTERSNGSPTAHWDHKARRAAFPGCRFGGLSSPPDQLGAGKPPEPAGRNACPTEQRFMESGKTKPASHLLSPTLSSITWRRGRSHRAARPGCLNSRAVGQWGPRREEVRSGNRPVGSPPAAQL